MGGGARRLGDREAAGGLQVDEAGRAVLARARQDDHRAIQVRILRQRGEEAVDRQVQPGLPAGEAEVAVQRDHAGVLGQDVDAAVLDLGQVLEPLHRQGRAVLQDLGQMGLLVGIEVRDDQDREGRFVRQRTEDRAERVDAACRAAKHHHPQGPLLLCIHPRSRRAERCGGVYSPPSRDRRGSARILEGV